MSFMKEFVRALSLTSMGVGIVVVGLTPSDARACSIFYPDDRFYQSVAPRGGVFVAHLVDADEDPATLDAIPDGALLRGNSGRTFPFVVVSRAGPSISFRAPVDAEPNEVLHVEGVDLQWEWDDRSDVPLTVTDDDVSDAGQTPIGDLSIEVRADVTTKNMIIPLPDPDAAYGCGSNNAGLKALERRHQAVMVVNDVVTGDDMFMLDVWITDEGEELDVDTAVPAYAGYSFGKEAFSNVVAFDLETDIDVILPIEAGSTKTVHARLREVVTGVAGPISQATVSVPLDEDEGVGCAQQRVSDVDAPIPALALALLAPLVGFRRRRM